MKDSKKAAFLTFLFGLVLGNKVIPIMWHILYIAIIVLLLLSSPIISLIKSI